MSLPNPGMNSRFPATPDRAAIACVASICVSSFTLLVAMSSSGANISSLSAFLPVDVTSPACPARSPALLSLGGVLTGREYLNRASNPSVLQAGAHNIFFLWKNFHRMSIFEKRMEFAGLESRGPS